MSLPERLEQAAEALPDDADAIRPANGDPHRLRAVLDAAAAARVLSWLLAHAPAEAEELATAWLEEPEGGAVLAAIGEDALPKSGRKALRRLVHRARTRGVEVPAGPAPAARVARLPDLDQSISAAYVSPLDPRGGRLVYLIESTPAGGARVFELLIDDERGLLDFQVYRAGRRPVRDFVKQVTRRPGGFAVVEAESGAVKALVARALARHPATRPLPKPFPEWRTRIVAGGDGAPTPGDEVRRGLEAGPADPADGERLADAVRRRELGPWPPAPDRLEAALAELRARAEAAGEAAAGSLADWTREAVADLYVGERAALCAERFEETAYVHWRRGDAALARAGLAAADALRAGGGAEVPAVGALIDAVAEALVEDLKKNLGLGSMAGAGEDRSE